MRINNTEGALICDMQEDNVLNDEDDNVLMLAYAEGQADAFDTLYERYRQPMYRFVLNGCSDKAIAGELFQDIWMSVIQSRTQFKDSGTFKSWLYRIARNKLIDFYRKNPNESFEEFNEENVSETISTLETPLTPNEVAELSCERENVQLAINSLPWKQRDTVILKYIAGFSLAEISNEQGESIETVKSRLRYAYKRLRQQLRALS